MVMPIDPRAAALMGPNAPITPPTDPRTRAIEQYMQQQGNQSRMPVMPSEDVTNSLPLGPGTQNDMGMPIPSGNAPLDTMRNAMRTRVQNPRSPDEDEMDEQDELARMEKEDDDEEMLRTVQKGMDDGDDSYLEDTEDMDDDELAEYKMFAKQQMTQGVPANQIRKMWDEQQADDSSIDDRM